VKGLQGSMGWANINFVSLMTAWACSVVIRYGFSSKEHWAARLTLQHGSGSWLAVFLFLLRGVRWWGSRWLPAQRAEGRGQRAHQCKEFAGKHNLCASNPAQLPPFVTAWRYNGSIVLNLLAYKE
jgi:hypothetical protein